MEYIFCDDICYDSDKLLGPNKKLVADKSGFASDMSSNSIAYVLHTTSNYSGVISSKKLLASTGCMVGGVYTTPLCVEKNGELRLHNLGVEYKSEACNFAINNGKGLFDVESLILQISSDASCNHTCGINYLRGGVHYYNTFLKVLPYMDKDLVKDIKGVILAKFQKGLGGGYRFLDILLSNRIFDKSSIDVIVEYALDYPVLAYVYFEAIAVAVMVNDISYNARLYAEIGELYNGSHRRMLFDLYPNFFNKFDVSLFRPELKVVIDYIESHKICNVQSFLSDFYLILTDLLRVALLNIGTYSVDKSKTYLISMMVYSDCYYHLLDMK